MPYKSEASGIFSFSLIHAHDSQSWGRKKKLKDLHEDLDMLDMSGFDLVLPHRVLSAEYGCCVTCGVFLHFSRSAFWTPVD